MTLDLNDAGPQRGFDLIPAGTICHRANGDPSGRSRRGRLAEAFGERWLRRLDCEFTVVDGPFAKRKIWQLMLLSGTTDGHAKAAEISRAMLRGILEVGPQHQAERCFVKRRWPNVRRTSQTSTICGSSRASRIEKSKDPAYPDKNRLEAITPDQRQWVAVEQIAGRRRICRG